MNRKVKAKVIHYPNKKNDEKIIKKRNLCQSSIFVRIRPQATEGGHVHDETQQVEKSLHSWTENSVSISDSHEIVEYPFPKKVFNPECSQHEVYSGIAPELLNSFLNEGHNVLLFAYGQTGTGKTYTMFGPDYSLIEENHPDRGLFPRVVSTTLNAMRDQGKEFILMASGVEFYLFQTFDLLNKRAVIDIGDDYEPMGQKHIEIKKVQDIIPFLETIRAHRVTRHTRMNIQTNEHGGSSRSHCALILTLLQVDSATKNYTKTSFHLVDLAGAERPDKTGEERISMFEAYMQFFQNKPVSTGAQGIIINGELFNMGASAIQAASCHRRGIVFKQPKSMAYGALLYFGGFLDGSFRLSMIVCLSQAPSSGWETWFSCRYGTDLSKLCAPLRVQRSRDLREEIEKSKKQLDSAEIAFRRTPQSGKPSSKFYFKRQLEVLKWSQQLKALEELGGKINLF